MKRLISLILVVVGLTALANPPVYDDHSPGIYYPIVDVTITKVCSPSALMTVSSTLVDTTIHVMVVGEDLKESRYLISNVDTSATIDNSIMVPEAEYMITNDQLSLNQLKSNYSHLTHLSQALSSSPSWNCSSTGGMGNWCSCKNAPLTTTPTTLSTKHNIQRPPDIPRMVSYLQV